MNDELVSRRKIGEIRKLDSECNEERAMYLKLLVLGLLFNMPYLLANQGLFEDKAEISDNDIRPPDVIHWNMESATAYKDGVVEVTLNLETSNNFTLYSNKVSFANPDGYTINSFKGPNTAKLTDPLTGKEVNVYRSGRFVLSFIGFEAYSRASFELQITYLGCTDRICLFPYTESFSVPTYKNYGNFANTGGENPTQDLSQEQGSNAVQVSSSEPVVASVDTGSATEAMQHVLAKKVSSNTLPIALTLILIFLGGVLTNLTPCVYPMIPITIRLLANQGQSPIASAASYSLGIVLTYSTLGLFAAFTGSMFGQLMANTWVSLSFAIVMALLALSMLGFGNWSSVQNFGNKISAKRPSLANSFLMGAGAGLVASPCTGPVLAALLAYAASQNQASMTILMLLTYSLGFGLPYLFLGSLASRLAEVRLAPHYQTLVKLLFAAVMFALSFYYLKVPAQAYFSKLDGHWHFLMQLFLAGGLLFAGAIVMRPKWASQKTIILIPSLLLAIGGFSAYQYTPEAEEGTLVIEWLKSEEEALKLHKDQQRPLLIDMWAQWCEACKKMDATTFKDQTLIKALKDKSWVLLKLDLTESSDQNDEIQKRYKISGLPSLVIMRPDNSETKKLSGYVSASQLLKEVQSLH